MKPISRLLSGVNDALPQFLQFLINLIPVISEVFKNSCQRLGKRGLQVRVIYELNIKVVAYCVLNFCSLGLCSLACTNLFLKIIVKDRNGFYLTSIPFDSR